MSAVQLEETSSLLCLLAIFKDLYHWMEGMDFSLLAQEKGGKVSAGQAYTIKLQNTNIHKHMCES